MNESRLIRISDAGKDQWSKRRGLYRCICGTEKAIDDHSVRAGKTKSCGCLNRESLQDRNKIRKRAAAGGRAIKGRTAPCKGLILIYEFQSKYSKPRGRKLWVTLPELFQIHSGYNGNRFVKHRK